MSRLAGIVCALALALALPEAAAAELPVHYSAAYAATYAAGHINGPPPGANDWSCRPSAAHPRPVVLVHGTLENMAYNWATLSPLLVDEGYCVFALNYGFDRTPATFPGATQSGGTGDIHASANQLKLFVDQVLSKTGARRVDIVGHSQGGLMARQYLRFLGGKAKVGSLVGLSPSNHGTVIDATLLCTACGQQHVGSPFLTELNAGGDTIGKVRYTVIETRYDEVVVPYTSAFLTGKRVTNIVLQKQCPQDLADHLATPFDRNALRYVRNALDPKTAHVADCVPVAPVGGG